MKNMNFAVMDRVTREYAIKQTNISKKFFSPFYQNLEQIVKPYVFTGKIKVVNVGKDKICLISVDNGKNRA